LAPRKPRPFDRILIDDTSRLARNVADALKMVERLSFYGVHVTFISQGIDTADKTARQLVTIHGMMDEQFLVGLGRQSPSRTGGPGIERPEPWRQVLWVYQRAD